MWRIGTVASVTEGWGFNITDESGRQLVAFAYGTHGEAVVAARHVQAAVEKALGVHPMSQG
jgi:D-tyrosyl-tRNA(Tyr) deacylase